MSLVQRPDTDIWHNADTASTAHGAHPHADIIKQQTGRGWLAQILSLLPMP